MAEQRNPGLDLARALAISMVLVFHASTFLQPWIGSPHALSLLGYAGVDLFFALSGYLIGGIIIRYQSISGPGRWMSRFLARRWIRTLPNYFLFLAIHLVYHLWRHETLPPRLVLYPVFLQSVHDFQMGAGTGFFVESWSLCVEEWFYVAFPCALLLMGLGRTAGAASVRRAVWLFIAFGFVTRLIGVIWGGLPWQPDLNRPVIFRLDAIACGILVRSMHKQEPSLGHNRILILVGLGLLLGSLALLVSMGIHRPLDAVAVATPLFIPLGFACLLPSLTTWSPTRNNIVAHAVGRLSRWSYSAYLCNMLIMLLLYERLTKSTLPGALLIMVVFIISTLACSAMVYHGFEQRILDWREKRFPDPKPAGKPSAAN